MSNTTQALSRIEAILMIAVLLKSERLLQQEQQILTCRKKGSI